MQLLEDEGLSIQHPHHLAATSEGRRRVLRVTLCAERRGTTPMHRVALAGRDPRGSRSAREASASASREAKSRDRNPGDSRPCFKDFGEAVRRGGRDQLESSMSTSACLRPLWAEAEWSHLGQLAALSSRRVRSVPGMTMFAEDGELRRCRVGRAGRPRPTRLRPQRRGHAQLHRRTASSPTTRSTASATPTSATSSTSSGTSPRRRWSSSSRTTAPRRRSSPPPTPWSSATASGGRSSSGPRSPAVSRCSSPSSPTSTRRRAGWRGRSSASPRRTGSSARTSPSSTGPTR